VVSDVAQETVADPDDPRRGRIVILARSWWISVIVVASMLYVEIDERTPRSPIAVPDAPTVFHLTPLLATPAHPASPTFVYLTVACILASAATCIVFIRRLTALQELRFQPAPDDAVVRKASI
jgi:hypothetical protein